MNCFQEFCNGGELFRRMEVERMMTEDVAIFYLVTIQLRSLLKFSRKKIEIHTL